MLTHKEEVAAGARFEFGRNWSQFLDLLNEDRIAEAEQSLQQSFGVTRLDGRRVLDAGSGSGLFSLAAWRLGARVCSFDYDADSVKCTETVRARAQADPSSWEVREGSVLDRDFVSGLGQFDIVYSWGVLHHTGQMWQAIDNVTGAVQPNGRLLIALYNDQGIWSRYWTWAKRTYVRHWWARPLLLGAHAIYPLAPSLLFRAGTGRLKASRGMAFWRDHVDWVGGYPFEVARPDAVIEFLRVRGFLLERLTSTTRLGCNEFVFVKVAT